MLALSGGGDSVALLHLASAWARANGRPLLALTVDHGLNPDSADWTRRAGEAAQAVGADWRALEWTGPKPSTGLPAAAREARHRLLAGAARAAGARVILMAHTADDVAEGELMRANGSTLGRLQDWSPSPVWPDGRGLMLLRPLLEARRGDLRVWLASQALAWIEDPANDDLRHPRVRARRALAGMTPTPGPDEPGPVHGVLAVEDDLIRLARDASARALSAALVCAGGGDRPPRGDRLAALSARLRAGERFTASLCGARVAADRAGVTISREAGEFRRSAASAPTALPPGVETVWDGRWALTASGDGWSVVPALGRIATLPEADQAALRRLPAAVRGGRPVLIRNDPGAAVLAGTALKATALVEQRLTSALDGMTHEQDLDAKAHGAPPRNHLFSGVTSTAW